MNIYKFYVSYNNIKAVYMNIIVHFTEDKRKDEELINKVFEKAFIEYIESQGKEK